MSTPHCRSRAQIARLRLTVGRAPRATLDARAVIVIEGVGVKPMLPYRSTSSPPPSLADLSSSATRQNCVWRNCRFDQSAQGIQSTRRAHSAQRLRAACSISAAACQSPAARAFAMPARRTAVAAVDLTGLGVRLAELLVSGHLIVGMIGDQGPEPVAALLDVPLAQALNRQAVTEKRVGRILGQALFQHQPPRDFSAIETLDSSNSPIKPRIANLAQARDEFIVSRRPGDSTVNATLLPVNTPQPSISVTRSHPDIVS